MGHVVFSADTGYVVHRPNPEQDAYAEDYDDTGENFQGRQPIIVKDRDIYVGGKDWYHADTATHHQLGNYYFDGAKEGYFGSQSPQWGGGDLKWYNPHPDHAGVAQALTQAGYNIPNHEQPEEENHDDPDLWADDPPEYHHPLDEQDEWR